MTVTRTDTYTPGHLGLYPESEERLISGKCAAYSSLETLSCSECTVSCKLYVDEIPQPAILLARAMEIDIEAKAPQRQTVTFGRVKLVGFGGLVLGGGGSARSPQALQWTCDPSNRFWTAWGLC